MENITKNIVLEKPDYNFVKQYAHEQGLGQRGVSAALRIMIRYFQNAHEGTRKAIIEQSMSRAMEEKQTENNELKARIENLIQDYEKRVSRLVNIQDAIKENGLGILAGWIGIYGKSISDLKEIIKYPGEPQMNDRNLIKIDENKFAYRAHYQKDWKVLPVDKVEAAFNIHFPGQEFDLEKAAIAINLERLDLISY